MDTALYLLFGRARASVLNALHRAADEDTPLHLREIARRAALSPSAVQYELRLLSQLDLVKDIGTDSRPLYVLNREHALFADLRNLFARKAEAAPLEDDARFAAKRVHQRKARQARSRENSPFLREWGTLSSRLKVR